MMDSVSLVGRAEELGFVQRALRGARAGVVGMGAGGVDLGSLTFLSQFGNADVLLIATQLDHKITRLLDATSPAATL